MMINPLSPVGTLQAPTESTTKPAEKPVPFTVQDKVTLSSVGDKDHDKDSE